MKKKVNLIALVVLVIAGSFLILQSFDEYWYLAGAKTTDKESAIQEYVEEALGVDVIDYAIAYQFDEKVVNVYADSNGNTGIIETIEENGTTIVTTLSLEYTDNYFTKLRFDNKYIYISVDSENYMSDVENPKYNQIELGYLDGVKTVYITVYDGN